MGIVTSLLTYSCYGVIAFVDRCVLRSFTPVWNFVFTRTGRSLLILLAWTASISVSAAPQSYALERDVDRVAERVGALEKRHDKDKDNADTHHANVNSKLAAIQVELKVLDQIEGQTMETRADIRLVLLGTLSILIGLLAWLVRTILTPWLSRLIVPAKE